LAVIDFLPRAGDRYVTRVGARNSEWAPVPAFSALSDFALTAEERALAATDYRILVSTVANIEFLDADREDTENGDRWIAIKDYTDTDLNAAWTLDLQNRPRDITAIKFCVRGSGGTDPTSGALRQGETFKVTWPMFVPADIREAAKDAIAWNSAAYNVQFLTRKSEDPHTLRSTCWEPEAVGIAVKGGTDGQLRLTKSLIHPNEFEQSAFTFALTAGSSNPVYVKRDGAGAYDYIYTDNASESDALTIELGDAKTASVLIGGLPEDLYAVEERGGHTREYRALPAVYKSVVREERGESAEAAYVWDNFKEPSAHAEIVNIAPRPYTLLVRKELQNVSAASNKRFAFELRDENNAGVRLTGPEDGSYTYASAGGDATQFTVDVNAEGSGYAMISGLPKGSYRVVELTPGYEARYAYAYIPWDGEEKYIGETDVTVSIDHPETLYRVTVTNHVSVPGGHTSPPVETTEPKDRAPDDGETANAGGGGDETGADGDGTDPSALPRPISPGGSLIPAGDGVYVEIDENGLPLGEWRRDANGQWIFDEYPPLADRLPQTGPRGAASETGRTVYPFICGFTLLLLTLLPAAPRVKKRRQRH
ncbi:MAG: hypothetical protein LBE16_07640, partial [Clostridiales Family XIII bacterium]|nr:hypothetical protein [Clostridiales Family XIII bacterium]